MKAVGRPRLEDTAFKVPGKKLPLLSAMKQYMIDNSYNKAKMKSETVDLGEISSWFWFLLSLYFPLFSSHCAPPSEPLPFCYIIYFSVIIFIPLHSLFYLSPNLSVVFPFLFSQLNSHNGREERNV